MTPTETSATTTPLTPGRDLDVAVARAMDLECRDDRSLPQVWVRPTDHWVPFDVSTDDATALRWGVPHLRALGFDVSIHCYADEVSKRETVWVATIRQVAGKMDQRVDAFSDADNRIAAALAQVIVAVAGARHGE